MGVETGSDVALAFGLVIAAGFSTTVGAAFAFCARIADSKTMAIALGGSAGVMLYVSFVEIFTDKAFEGFGDAEYSKNAAKAYATFCFFGGLLITAAMNGIVHYIYELIQKGAPRAPRAPPPPTSGPRETEMVPDKKDEETSDIEHGRQKINQAFQKNVNCCCCGPLSNTDEHKCHLQKVGLLTGLAIALHNFPEGLATFVSTLADPSAGIAIAIAIALHNIPEGVAVAMPVYCATNSRWQGFFWAFFSGITEPIGALFGWLVLSNLGDLANAIMFAIVAGMMVYISVRELITTALRFDPEDKLVTISVFGGMAVMAASLLLFKL